MNETMETYAARHCCGGNCRRIEPMDVVSLRRDTVTVEGLKINARAHGVVLERNASILLVSFSGVRALMAAADVMRIGSIAPAVASA